MSSEPYNPFSKDEKRKLQPGYKKALEKEARRKGQDQERELARKLNGKVNNQRGAGGDISVPDVSFGRFNVESKVGPDEPIRKTIRDHLKTVPWNKRPAVAFVVDGVKWMAYRLDDDAAYIEDRAEAQGFILERIQK